MKNATQLIYSLLLIGLGVGVTPVAFGQSKFSVSVTAAPIWSVGRTGATFTFPGGSSGLSTLSVTSKANGFAYSIGLLGRYIASPNWSVATGIWRIQGVSATGEFTQNGQTVRVSFPNDSPTTVNYTVPLLINYHPTTKRLSPYLSAGATAAFQSKQYVNLGGGQITEVRFGKPILFAPLLGIGAAYQLSDHLSMIVQPTVQMLFPPDNNTYDYYRVFEFSAQTQLMYRF